MQKLLIAIAILGFGLLRAELTDIQKHYLSSPLVHENNGTLIIEEYHKIFLRQKMDIPFDNKQHEYLIQRTVAYMKKGILSRDQMVSLYSSFSDELTQVSFMPLLKFGAIKNVKLLMDKPQKYDISIIINIKNTGIDTAVETRAGKEKKHIDFEKIFDIQF